METKILDPNTPPEPPDDGSHAPEQKPSLGSPHAVLVIFESSPKTLQFDLIDRVTIGRRSEAGQQPDIDVAPFGGFPAGVSRLHARLHRVDKSIIIEDLASRNGTFLDDVQVKPGELTPIRNGQSFRLGALRGWIYFENT
ncbi:MAG: FHA domain-containing protein [Anaerolineae bacterium]|nr:FHA domain-containing protein [Anaerolineae bacterium]